MESARTFIVNDGVYENLVFLLAGVGCGWEDEKEGSDSCCGDLYAARSSVMIVPGTLGNRLFSPDAQNAG